MTTTSAAVQFADMLNELETDRLFAHVAIDRLKIDHTYQRVVDMQRVRKYVAIFDERMIGALVCSVREDGIYVIDGQHRLEVLRILGAQTVRCELRTGLTLTDEARLFYELDTRRVSLRSDDAFRALITANDPIATSIVDAVERAGLKVSYAGGVIGGVRAFKTLLALTNQYGIGRIQDCLTVLHNAWPESTNPAPASILEGLAHFLGKYPEVNLKELARTMGVNTSPERLISGARAISGSLSWNTKTSMARSILSAYNNRRSKHRLDDRLA